MVIFKTATLLFDKMLMKYFLMDKIITDYRTKLHATKLSHSGCPIVCYININ